MLIPGQGEVELSKWLDKEGKNDEKGCHSHNRDRLFATLDELRSKCSKGGIRSDGE